MGWVAKEEDGMGCEGGYQSCLLKWLLLGGAEHSNHISSPSPALLCLAGALG